jgi:polyisoprenoid-binding protein YceI
MFEQPLMQEHFNENYMESEKYPNASLDGIIQEKIDYTKNGEYVATVKGKLTMHGVTKDIEVKGKLTVKDNVIVMDAKFQAKLEDYKILLHKNVAKVIDVTINSKLEPFEKK